METNWNQLIERYLNGELSAEGKTAFEQQLKESPELQKELELHQLTQNLIKRAAIRNMVQKSGKTYHFRKTLTKAGIILLIVAIAAYVLLHNIVLMGAAPDHSHSKEVIEQALLEEMNKELAFDHVHPQFFKFTGQDDIFLSESGVLLSITDHSFLLDGKPYKGEAVVQWQEAQTGADIVKAGLSTTSGDKLLETQGMFSLNAFTPDGKKLELSDKGIYVQVPVDELKKDMMLFNGVKGKDGKIDWQSPEELERLPKPKSMKDMDLFPPKYEPKLNELKWFTDKEKRDSLYLSFDETMEVPIPMDDTTSSGNNPTLEIKSIDPFTSNQTNETDNLFNDAQSSSIDMGIDAQLEKFPTIADSWTLYPEYVKPGYALLVSQVYKSREFVKFNGVLDHSYSLLLSPSENIQLIGEPTVMVSNIDPYTNQLISPLDSFVSITVNQKVKVLTKKPFDLSGILYCKTLDSPNKASDPQIPVSWLIEYFNDSGSNNERISHIPPSKVLAIWDKKFDNTILATQDFEDRMKFIHNTCDERVFDIYAKNLNEPLWKLDQKVVKLGYKEFQQFADQRVGSLKLNDEHQKNLATFYDKAIKSIREKGKDAMLSALKKEQEWDNDLDKERSDEVMRKGLRESANLNEEYGFNLQNVYKQLGITVAFQMHGGGTIVNIDKYVWDATVARQSTLITEPNTGKTAQITYNPMKLEVDESEKYDQLYVYLFSKEINSYQRLDLKNGKLDYSLNGDMNYTAAIVGMNDDGYFIREISPLKDGDLGKFSLKQVSEAEFDKTINALNNERTDKPMSLDSELKWLFNERANYTVQKQRRENAAFRATIRPTIYSCGQIAYEMPIEMNFK